MYLLIGFGSGLIIFPILLGIYVLIRNAKERRKIKRLMKQGKILKPIDPKDYDVEAWKNKRYGNITLNIDDLNNFNARLFKKSIESSDDNFMVRVMDYIKEAKKHGYSDEQIKEEFRKKSYTEELINKIFLEIR
jgi:hypothetical protein